MITNEERVGLGVPTVDSVRYDQIYSYDSSRVDIKNLFTLYENNRGGMLKQLQGHIDGMVKSIAAGRFEWFPPIVVDINTLVIVDGNCRYSAVRKSLESGVVDKIVLRVVFINVSQEDIDKVVIDYNTTSKSWTTANFIYNFSKRGLKSFTKLIYFCDESEYLHDKNGKIKPRYAVAILGKPSDSLKDTQMTLTDEELNTGKKALSEAIFIKNLIEKKNHDANGCWMESFFRAWVEFRNDYLLAKSVSFDTYFQTMKARLKQTEIPYASSKKTSWKTWFLAVAAYV